VNFSRLPFLITAILLFILEPGTAQAHLVNTQFGDFYAGMLHPVTALEHLLPMLALGLLAGQQGTAKARIVLFVFPVGLAIGAVLSLVNPTYTSLTYINFISFLILGALVAADWQIPKSVIFILATLFGITHGYVNGTALSKGMSAHLFLPGFIMTGLIIVSLSPAMVLSLKAGWSRIAVRVAGSWITAIGMMMLAFLWKK
jgi:urease accessory protein